MTHHSLEVQVDAYLDRELTTADALDLEAHLAQCAECRRFRDERLALRAAITSQIPNVVAPDALRDRVRAALAAEARADKRPQRRVSSYWRALAIAASLLIVAVGSWNLALRKANADHLTDAVFASHVRSLMLGHLTDVPSSDQHTVKPWFNGKLDFSPPVHDLAAQGYPLVGGRLDYVDGQSVAVLVYRRRQHPINVFVWPATRGPSGMLRASDRQGYHLLHWATSDYTYQVVSDLGLPELKDFARLLQRADSTGG